MFDRFQNKPKLVMRAAREEALALGHDTIRTGHILLGLLREEPELAEQAMPGISIDAVRREIEARVGKGTHRGAGQLPFTQNGKKAFELAMYAAADSVQIGSHHLLLGLVGATGGLAAKILVALGFAREQIEQRVRQMKHPGALESDERAVTLLHLAQACGSAEPRRLVATFLQAEPLSRLLQELPAAVHDALRRLPLPPSDSLGAHWRPEVSASHWSGIEPNSRGLLAHVLEALNALADHFGDTQASLDIKIIRASIDAARD